MHIISSFFLDGGDVLSALLDAVLKSKVKEKEEEEEEEDAATTFSEVDGRWRFVLHALRVLKSLGMAVADPERSEKDKMISVKQQQQVPVCSRRRDLFLPELPLIFRYPASSSWWLPLGSSPTSCPAWGSPWRGGPSSSSALGEEAVLRGTRRMMILKRSGREGATSMLLVHDFLKIFFFSEVFSPGAHHHVSDVLPGAEAAWRSLPDQAPGRPHGGPHPARARAAQEAGQGRCRRGEEGGGGGATEVRHDRGEARPPPGGAGSLQERPRRPHGPRVPATRGQVPPRHPEQRGVLVLFLLDLVLVDPGQSEVVEGRLRGAAERQAHEEERSQKCHQVGGTPGSPPFFARAM